jgi:ubiquinone/menaquinone biosynthesis C-methylase UbiE
MLIPHAGAFTGIDPDEVRLSKARLRVPSADFRNGSGEALDFPDASFDIAAFTFSLHHQDATKALAEASRVLRPGGTVVVVEPDLDGDMHPLFRLFRQEDDQITGARKTLMSSGLEVLSDESFDIEYLFDGMEDLYEYFFGNYNLPRERAIMARMAAVVGARASERPMRLLERANITALLKA